MSNFKYCQKPTVLIPIVCSGPKTWAFRFFPKFAKAIKYPYKEVLLITGKNCPELKKITVGEQIAATGRQFAINYAKKHNFEYIYFLDLDLEVQSDILHSLLSVKHPLVGSLVAARGNPFLVIGHNYGSFSALDRIPLYYPDLKTGDEVGGIGGCSLLVHKSIFSKVDYSGYTGPRVIPGRHTADDEYLQIQIYKKLRIKPKIYVGDTSWHYHEDGFTYSLLGKKKKWNQDPLPY